jgi:hypothetical protein
MARSLVFLFLTKLVSLLSELTQASPKTSLPSIFSPHLGDTHFEEILQAE